VRVLCRTLDVHPRGYYDWLKSPVSKRKREDQQLAQKIKQFWIESGGFHGYRNIYMDFRDANQYCGRDRILRLMQKEGIRAQRGYNTPRGYYGGKTIRKLHLFKPIVCLTNRLHRAFIVLAEFE